MDFGSAASDYAKHRPGFPPSLFERVPLAGRVLDLGTGTGTLARGYRERGCDTVASDLSPAMLAQAAGAGRRIAAKAEALPFAAGSFDAVTAGQCWHWFDGPRAAAECARVLRGGGKIVIAHFDYQVRPGNAAEATEALVLEMNPGWPLAHAKLGHVRYDRHWIPHLTGAGFTEVESFEWEEPVRFSHESWRGRFRACNGVMALKTPQKIGAFDQELTRRLAASFPEPLDVPHRVVVIAGRRPPV